MAPTTRERSALRNIDDSDDWHHPADLRPAGEKTRREMLEKGWIEHASHPVSGEPGFRITKAGKEAMRLPVPPKPHATGPKLRMQEPLVRIADPWIAKPRKA